MSQTKLHHELSKRTRSWLGKYVTQRGFRWMQEFTLINGLRPDAVAFCDLQQGYYEEFTRSIIDWKKIESDTILLEKDNKVAQVQEYVSNLLQSTDKFYIRKMERGIEIPREIIDERTYIHSECDRMKSDIQSLTDVKSVLTYEYRIDNLQYHEHN